jgi:hypothetical protein
VSDLTKLFFIGLPHASAPSRLGNDNRCRPARDESAGISQLRLDSHLLHAAVLKLFYVADVSGQMGHHLWQARH